MANNADENSEELLTFGEWIRQDIDTCLASINVTIERDYEEVIISIGNPFSINHLTHIDEIRYFLRNKSMNGGLPEKVRDCLKSKVESFDLPESPLASFGQNEAGWISHLVCETIISKMREDNVMQKICKSVEQMIRDAHEIVAVIDEQHTDRLNKRINTAIKSADAIESNVKVFADKGYYRKGYKKLCYKITILDDNGNWCETKHYYDTCDEVKDSYKNQSIIFVSSRGNLTLFDPSKAKAKKPTRAELEAELAMLRAKIGDA